jgi:hypothetical protein
MTMCHTEHDAHKRNGSADLLTLNVRGRPSSHRRSGRLAGLPAMPAATGGRDCPLAGVSGCGGNR